MARSNNNYEWLGSSDSEPPVRKQGLAEARPSTLIQLVGDFDHPDFRDAIDLLRSESR